MSAGQSLDPTLAAGTLSVGPDARRKSVIAVAYVILGALTLSPLLWAAVPPLVDYPDHLARMWILLHAKDIPALAQNYVVDWRLLPNLAMDLTVPALAQVLPLEVAGRVFIAVTMANLVLATAALHRVLHGRVGLWPLCALLFVYNAVLFWGFLNFLFTLGLALLTFSGWIASERWSLRRRVLVFSLPASLLFVFHLFAFGVYGLLAASYELGRWPQHPGGRPRRAVTMLLPLTQFIPAGALWLASLDNGGATYTAYGDVASKLYAIFAPGTFDASPVLLDRAVLVLGLAFFLYGRHTGALKISPSMRMPLAAMVVLAVLMPNWLSGSWGADFRLPVALPFVLIASARFEASRRMPAAVFAVLALVLLGLRICAVSAIWQDTDRHFAEFRAASRRIPEGVRLLVVQTRMSPLEARVAGLPPVLAVRQDLALSHMPALAVIDRAAFVPYLFTAWAPMRPNPRHAGLSEPVAEPMDPEEFIAGAASEQRPTIFSPNPLGERPYWRDWPETFDFVLWIDFSHAAPPPLGEHLQLQASGSFFRIYRIVRT